MSGRPRPRRLPDGATVRIRTDITRLDGGRLLIGGSPLRALRLPESLAAWAASEEPTVRDAATADLAARLLAGNLADPTPPVPVDAGELTVVIPVRDRAEQLDRALAALAGLAVVVVDDASHEPEAVHAVVTRHGAELVVLTENLGPAGARNAGLARVRTAYVAFVDSDLVVAPETLRAVAGHLGDPQVVLVAPRVRGRRPGTRAPRWFERYDAAASSLDLGGRGGSVQPGAAVSYLPSACLVARVEALGEGFRADLRAGEDVDLVWRLVGAGRTVRYDPSHEAAHDVRDTARGWLGRKVVYGSSAAELAARHGQAVAPAVLSPVMAVAGAAILLCRPWAVPVALLATAWSARQVAGTLPAVPGRTRLAAELALRGLGWAVRQEATLLLRHWWPAVVPAAIASAAVRRAVGTALLIDTAVALTLDRPDPVAGVRLDPATRVLGRRLDDLAYGAGVWLGAARRRSLACLRPRIVRSSSGQQG
ncbi:mycofactocin biosynthesis glycosyltransferase MftF [Nocardioides insulae]|uniref:mycofactocin biosynthesis glycosyltransferase MftF n=1 Tax=Nocardioides insulae TaxID=394734 RepID=UPI00041DDF34|nr:mycofactocin biosynthesis glycosyltransferase MftF [Nocardioides insulae]